MPNKELMLRLRRNGKIVGYYLLCSLDRAKEIGLNIHWFAKPPVKYPKNIIRFWKRDGNVWWGCEPMVPPQSDSFDIGIQVGEERWFEGDRIKTRSGLGTIVYEPGECGIPDWGVRMDSGSNQCLWYMIGEGQDPHLLDGRTHEEVAP